MVTYQLDTQFWLQLRQLRKKQQPAGDSSADPLFENAEIPQPSRMKQPEESGTNNVSLITGSASEKELSDEPCKRHVVENEPTKDAMRLVGFIHPSSHALSQIGNLGQPLIAEHPQTSL